MWETVSQIIKIKRLRFSVINFVVVYEKFWNFISTNLICKRRRRAIFFLYKIFMFLWEINSRACVVVSNYFLTTVCFSTYASNIISQNINQAFLYIFMSSWLITIKIVCSLLLTKFQTLYGCVIEEQVAHFLKQLLWVT